MYLLSSTHRHDSTDIIVTPDEKLGSFVIASCIVLAFSFLGSLHKITSRTKGCLKSHSSSEKSLLRGSQESKRPKECPTKAHEACANLRPVFSGLPNAGIATRTGGGRRSRMHFHVGTDKASKSWRRDFAQS